MKFWQAFFEKQNIYNNLRNENTDKNLLIQNLNLDNSLVNIYFSTDKNINIYDLEYLCNAVGWVRRPLKKVKIALDNSFIISQMFYYHNSKKILIGFARATSDTCFNATIWDVVIHPRFQKKGLGKTLMNQLIKKLRSQDISTITLFADPQVIKFYKNLGFIMDPDGVKGMFWYPI
uniref:N-acetyltransferase domain-containing protein n=1 Tax=Anotrichium furcellatum TaxID=41999 RepID=A0A4D6WKC3_9FLOR|nr:hypothetical protein [Anotrichium furcellatum]